MKPTTLRLLTLAIAIALLRVSRELEMTFDRPIKVNVDGQVLETERCSYSVLPRAIHFLAGS